MKTTLRTLTRIALLPVAALAFSACSSKMSKSDCEKADFYEIGLKDGKKGKSADRLKEITDMCGGHGVTVPAEKYTYGRQVGLADYCDAGRAESDAKDGKTDSICLQEKVPPYETAYNRALQKERDQKAEDLKKLQESKAKLQKKEDKIQGQLNQIDSQTQPAK